MMEKFSSSVSFKKPTQKMPRYGCFAKDYSS